MPSRQLAEHLAAGVLFNACSLHQLETVGRVAPGREISVRMNPGLGSGSANRTNTGGPASSFGIWHDYLEDVKTIAKRHELTIRRLHTHIGSGTDPEVWKRVTRMTLDLAARLPDVRIVNLGGGLKIGRMPGRSASSRSCKSRSPTPAAATPRASCSWRTFRKESATKLARRWSSKWAHSTLAKRSGSSSCSRPTRRDLSTT